MLPTIRRRSSGTAYSTSGCCARRSRQLAEVMPVANTTCTCSETAAPALIASPSRAPSAAARAAVAALGGEGRCALCGAAGPELHDHARRFGLGAGALRHELRRKRRQQRGERQYRPGAIAWHQPSSARSNSMRCHGQLAPDRWLKALTSGKPQVKACMAHVSILVRAAPRVGRPVVIRFSSSFGPGPPSIRTITIRRLPSGTRSHVSSDVPRGRFVSDHQAYVPSSSSGSRQCRCRSCTSCRPGAAAESCRIVRRQ